MNFSLASDEDIAVLYPAYYSYYCRLYGSTILKELANNAINKGNYNSKALSVMDYAYRETSDTISRAMSGDGLCIICIKDEQGKNIGFFRAKFFDSKGNISVTIGEVILPFAVDNEAECLSTLVEAIEKEIREDCPHIENLDFETTRRYHALTSVLYERGYHLLASEDKDNRYTSLYEKNLLETKVSRG